MQPKFLFAADTHLSKLVWSGRPDLAGDSHRAFDYVVDTAIRLGVPLLLGGDIFDAKKPTAESVEVAYNAMSRMAAANLPVYFIQGQHDMSDPPWLSVHNWPTHVHKKQFTIGGFKFYGLDWQPGVVLQTELAAIPAGTNFLMAHQVWKEHMGGIGNPEGSFTEVPHVQYVITGDYHKTQITDWPNATGAYLQAVSPGSTHMRAIDEAPDKYCYLFSARENSPDFQVDEIEIPSRPYLEQTINDQAELAAFCLAVSTLSPTDAVSKPLLRVIYNPELPEALDRIRQAVGDKAHLFESSMASQTCVDLQAVTTLQQAQTVNMASAILQLADSPDMVAAASQIWSSNDIPASLKTMFDTFERTTQC